MGRLLLQLWQMLALLLGGMGMLLLVLFALPADRFHVALGVAAFAVESLPVCCAGVCLVPFLAAKEALHLTLWFFLGSGYRVCLGFCLVGFGFSVCDFI